MSDELTMEERFASLEAATRSLSGDVQALTSIMGVVSELQVKQQEQQKRVAETEAKVEAARKDTYERMTRVNRVIAYMAVAFAVLVPTVTVLVYASLISHVNDMIAENNKTAYASCIMRNKATELNADREDALAAVENDPETAIIHTRSAEQLRRSFSDCSLWLETK